MARFIHSPVSINKMQPSVMRLKAELHKPSQIPLPQLKKQLYYRCKRMGSLEVEVVLTRWLDSHLEEMSEEQVRQFDHEVVQLENPVLHAYLLKGEEPHIYHDNHYINLLREYVGSLKK